MADVEKKKPDDANEAELERRKRLIDEVDIPPGQRSYPSTFNLPKGDGPNHSYKRDD